MCPSIGLSIVCFGSLPYYLYLLWTQRYEKKRKLPNLSTLFLFTVQTVYLISPPELGGVSEGRGGMRWCWFRPSLTPPILGEEEISTRWYLIAPPAREGKGVGSLGRERGWVSLAPHSYTQKLKFTPYPPMILCIFLIIKTKIIVGLPFYPTMYPLCTPYDSLTPYSGAPAGFVYRHKIFCV